MIAGRAGLTPHQTVMAVSRLVSRGFRQTRCHYVATSSRPFFSVLGAQQETYNSSADTTRTAFVLVALMAGATTTSTAFCDRKSATDTRPTPVQVAKEPQPDEQEDTNPLDSLPIFTSDQVAENDGSNNGRIWMSYGGVVYDVTDFVQNHPGGSDKIMQAAGQAIEPFWYIYRQHFASNLPMLLMERLAIGRLAEEDQAAIDEQMAVMEEEEGDPYQHEPVRHRALRVHSDTPMNAETPSHLLTKQWYTPNSLFYIRHHHPVPYLTPTELTDFRLTVDVSAYQKSGNGILKVTLDDLKKLPKREVTVTLQCSGNRRSGFNAYQRTTGTPWGQGAISTAKFGGVWLRDLLKQAGLDDPQAAQSSQGLQNIQFDALDGMVTSIDIEKACNPYGDVLIAYEMNGVPLPRDHGYPLRVIVPGYAAVRSVKWLSRVTLQKEEAMGPWSRGLNYKVLPPNVTDATGVNMDEMPSVMETTVYSGITNLHVVDASQSVSPGDRVTVRVSGWAWSGGGRKIARVDVTGDGGLSWVPCQLLMGADQRRGRAWAWTFWECEVNGCVVHEDGTVRLASKAVDSSLNTQIESNMPTWNVRGLNNNSWYRAQTQACPSEHI